ATSRPASATGKVNAWIGVQREKPALSRPASNAGCRSNELNVTSVKGLSLMLSSLRRCVLWARVIGGRTCLHRRRRRRTLRPQCRAPRAGTPLDPAAKRPSLTQYRWPSPARHRPRVPRTPQETPVSEKVTHVGDADFEAAVLNSDEPVLVDF